MSPRRLLFWAAAITAHAQALPAGLAARNSSPPPEPAPVSATVPTAAALPTRDEGSAFDSADQATSDAVAARLPSSLAGTQPDGALVVDASGAFVATPDAIDLFDYYLSASGEEPIEQIVARIESVIRARLDPPDEALGLLDQYLAYREEVRRMVEDEGLEALPLERRLQRLRETRRGIFGAERAEALFGEDEARARNAIAWQRVAADPSLGAEERAEQLAALEAEWPEAERERRERATVAERVITRETAMRNEGASEAEIQALREEEFGVDAAARLAELDREREAWKARVALYREERAKLESGTLAEPAAAAELEALRARLFEGPELVRIHALDEVEGRRANDP